MAKCPTCGEDKFETVSGMRQHHTRVHGEKLPNKECSECGEKFYYDGEKKLCKECYKEHRSIRDVPDEVEMTQEEWKNLSHYQRHYYENKDKEVQRAAEKRKEKRKWFQKLKNDLSCEKCSEEHNACLDFHHTQDKSFTVSNAVNRHGKEKIKKEIEKCKVLCANCHRKEHS